MDAGYILSTNSLRDDCGDPGAHSFSILGAISIKDKNGNKTDLLLLRNPWGFSLYNGSWNNSDPRWTDVLGPQVPVDPRTS